MSKLVLKKDPSHKGYYKDPDGDLYVFRFGGRPIKVDDYREDKPKENIEAEKVEVDKEEVIDHRKSASKQENEKFLEEAESEKSMREKMIKELEGKEDYPTKNHKERLERLQKDLEHEIDNTKERNDILEAVHNNEMNAMYYNMNELYDDLAGSLGVKTEEAKKLYNETYNEKEKLETYRANAAFGVGVIDLIIASGTKQVDIESTLELEENLNLIERLKPLQNSHVQSGSSGASSTTGKDVKNGENEEEQKDSSLDVQKDENNPGDNVSDKVKDSNKE